MTEHHRHSGVRSDLATDLAIPPLNENEIGQKLRSAAKSDGGSGLQGCTSRGKSEVASLQNFSPAHSREVEKNIMHFNFKITISPNNSKEQLIQ